jgi:hypothetical protein
MRVKYFFSGIFTSFVLVLLCVPDAISVNSAATSGQNGMAFVNDSTNPSSRTKDILKGAYNYVGGILSNRLVSKDTIAVSFLLVQSSSVPSLDCLFSLLAFEFFSHIFVS